MNAASTSHPHDSPPLFVDSHVHYYSNFDKRTLVSAAVRNIELAATSMGMVDPVGMLIFVENYGARDLSRLVEDLRQDKSSGWEVEPTAEGSSMGAFREGVRRLVLLPGRQIRTAEALEVLALDCGEDIPDGRPIRETLRRVYDFGSLAVVPWGFGKWWFDRGRVVRRLIDEEEPDRFFLGDNGGRPSSGPQPEHFRYAQGHGIRVLPGTDPLPLPGEEARAGSYGFVVAGPVNYERPGETLRQCLQNPAVSPVWYGSGSSWLACLRRQLLLRL